jgi:adenosylcobinamide amidohydrolase
MSAVRVALSSDERFLEVAFESPQRTLGWAIHGGGFGLHERVVWHFVRREELPFDVDPRALLAGRLAAEGYERAVGLLTARQLAPYGEATVEHGGITGRAWVTVGLGNALRAGDPPLSAPKVGTINILAHVSQPLSDLGLLEALALAAEARALALLELAYPSVVSGRPASGTGTDCIVVASPPVLEGVLPSDYAGKHTAAGAVLGESVRLATAEACERWLSERGPSKPQALSS